MKLFVKVLIWGFFVNLATQLLFLNNAIAYLDPGTGSYIFQVIIATIIGAAFTIKMFWQKIKIFFNKIFPKK